MNGTLWVATRWRPGRILITEVYLKPGRVFIIERGRLHVTEDNKTVDLGQILGFGPDLDLLKETLKLPDAEVFVVSAEGAPPVTEPV